jgi:hypothetical protein
MKIFEVTGDQKFDDMMKNITSPHATDTMIEALVIKLKESIRKEDYSMASELQHELERYGVFYENYDNVEDKLMMIRKLKDGEYTRIEK